MPNLTTSQGFNFRESENALVDAPNSGMYPLNNPAYSGALGYGYSATGPGTGGDHNFSTVVDVRLGGCHQINVNSGGSKKVRWDVNPGSIINFHLAMGRKGAGSNNFARLLDNGVELVVLLNGVTASSNQFVDANGTVHGSDNNWLANNTPYQITCTSGTLELEWGDWNLAGTGASMLSHVYLDFVSTGGTTHTQGVTGALTPAGALATELIEGGAGPQTYSGSVTPAGELSEIQVALDTLEGVVAPSGALAAVRSATTLPQSVSGSILPVGAVAARITHKNLTGSVGLAGLVTTDAVVTELKSIAGAIVPAGVLAARLLGDGAPFPKQYGPGRRRRWKFYGG